MKKEKQLEAKKCKKCGKETCKGRVYCNRCYADYAKEWYLKNKKTVLNARKAQALKAKKERMGKKDES